MTTTNQAIKPVEFVGLALGRRTGFMEREMRYAQEMRELYGSICRAAPREVMCLRIWGEKG